MGVSLRRFAEQAASGSSVRLVRSRPNFYHSVGVTTFDDLAKNHLERSALVVGK